MISCRRWSSSSARAAGLSAATVTRLTKQWGEDYQAFQDRDLSGVDYVYVWADGVHVNVRLEEARLCLLVVIGVRADGRKELVALADGYRESAESLSAALGLGPYDRLAEADKVYVQELTLATNHPQAYERYKAGLPPVPVEYTLFGEFTGANDADRCLRGQFSGCAWTAVSFSPLKPIKWGKTGVTWLRGLFRPASAVTRHGDELAARANLLPFCSFSPDTPVLMADGSTKPIAQVEPGDRVLAGDPVTGEQSPQTVAAVWVHEDTLINLVISPQGQLADH